VKSPSTILIVRSPVRCAAVTQTQ